MKMFLSSVPVLVTISLCAAQDKLPADMSAGDWRGVILHPSSPELETAAAALAKSRVSTENEALVVARKGGAPYMKDRHERAH